MVLSSKIIVQSIVFLLLSIIYIIMSYPIYKIIIGLGASRTVIVQSFIIFYLVTIAFTYMPILRLLQNKGYIEQ